MIVSFLSVIIIKRLCTLFTHPSEVPQIILLSVLCLISDYCKAFDKTHCLRKKIKPFFLPYFDC